MLPILQCKSRFSHTHTHTSHGKHANNRPQDVWHETTGCASYNYYLEPGLGSPRCDLYASVVAYELDSINQYEPYTWFDLECGNPTEYADST